MATRKPASKVASMKALTLNSLNKKAGKKRMAENALAKNVGLTDEDIQVMNAIDDMVEFED